jgi:hypothetical protein
MVLNVLKLASLAGLLLLTSGFLFGKRSGAVIAIATCVAGAAVFHFAAP